MIVFSRFLPPPELNMEVYNLTSLYEGYYRLKLIPPFSIFDTGGNDMDIAYVNWLFSTDFAFYDLMNVLDRVHMGKHVCILTMEDYKYDMIVESLEKFISNRYGIIPNYVNDYDDFNYLEDIGPRTPQDIYNFDNDRDLFLSRLLNTNKNMLFGYVKEMDNEEA